MEEVEVVQVVQEEVEQVVLELYWEQLVDQVIILVMAVMEDLEDSMEMEVKVVLLLAVVVELEVEMEVVQMGMVVQVYLDQEVAVEVR
jgi:hypothetical protein